MITLSDSKRRLLGFVAKVFYYLLFVVALLAIFGYLWENRSALGLALNAPAWIWFVPVLLYMGTLIAKGLGFDTLARVYGVRIPFIDSVGLTATGLLSNYAVPGNASLAIRTLYMHRVLGLNYKKFVPVALAAFVFSTGLYGIFIGIAAITFGEVPSHAYAIAILALSGSGLLLTFALMVPYHGIPLVGAWIETVLSGWRQLCKSRRHLIFWLGIIFVLSILEIGLFYSIVCILGIELTIAQTAIMVLAKENSVVLRITPGAFGVAEGVQIFFGTQFGIDISLILLAALIFRAIELLVIGCVSFALSGRLAQRVAIKARGSGVETHSM